MTPRDSSPGVPAAAPPAAATLGAATLPGRRQACGNAWPFRRSPLGIALALACTFIPSGGRAQSQQISESPDYAEPADASADYQVATVLSELNNPCGLVIRAGAVEGAPSVMCFSEAGAGRVMRVDLDVAPAAIPMIDGFPVSECPALGGATVGPLGLAFITKTKLAVGEGGKGPGADEIRIFAIDEPYPIGYPSPDHRVGPIQPARGPAQGAFFALALIEDEALFASSLTVAALADSDEEGGGAQSASLLKATVDANRAADLQRLGPPARGSQGGNLVATTVNPDPDQPYVVVSLQGAADDSPDSVIVFMSPHSGRQALALPCGLRDVVALAYSPSGRLYAADASWADGNEAGVYRLDAAMIDGRERCRPVRIAAASRPVSLAFGPDGVLYVAAWGEETDDSAGKIIKITGEL